MDYYKSRALANRKIDSLLSQGNSIELIKFKIDTEFGFSEKFVEQRLEKIENLKKLSEETKWFVPLVKQQ